MIENSSYFDMISKKRKVSLPSFSHFFLHEHLGDFFFFLNFPPIWGQEHSWQSVLRCKIITEDFLVLYLPNIPVLFCLFSLLLWLLFYCIL